MISILNHVNNFYVKFVKLWDIHFQDGIVENS